MLDPLSQERLNRLASFLPSGWTLDNARDRSEAAQLAALQGADFAITGDVPVTAEMFKSPGLKAVHKWGVGYDNIDCEAARANGVRVLRTTGSNAVSVAETALGMMLALQRNLARGHVAVMNGTWPKSELGATSRKLTERTIGIVGLGYIGKALVKLLQGFDCQILYFKPNRLDADEEANLGVTYVELNELLKRSDIVSLHCELNDSTQDMINRDALALMKPDAYLVNLARGGIVNEADLATALLSRQIAGAAVDVFSVEPITPDNPLLGIDTALLTPHLGAISNDSFAPTVSRMIRNLQQIEDGLEPPALDTLV
ncbi:MAG: 3-phosphoglycerate dehydrogenase [Rhodobacteraceae bacterium]|nr:3-phosphoglycerate dehydrogenase [Paracoccaceae bacterium]